jgi:hypothetical protein
MPRICSQCEHFEPERLLDDCPQCGGRMRFTLLGPAHGDSSAQTAVLAASCAAVEPPTQEVLEQPAAERTGQIGLALAFFVATRFVGTFMIQPDVDFFRQPNLGLRILVLLACVLLLYAGAAVLAGIIAGAWVVNWVRQGLVLAFWILVVPTIWLVWLGAAGIIVCLIIGIPTSALTLFGSYLGHRLIPPHRVMFS